MNLRNFATRAISSLNMVTLMAFIAPDFEALWSPGKTDHNKTSTRSNRVQSR